MSLYPTISHFVTTRHGGCSEGAYSSFNCSHFSADTARNVWSNQADLTNDLKLSMNELVIPQQTHGDKCLVIDELYFNAALGIRRSLLQNVDALITDEPGYCIGVSTADCVPILLYDKFAHVVAAVHAGWRGTVKYIVEKTLKRMNMLYGTRNENVIACIGPSISLESFEVGDEVHEAFQKAGFDMSRVSCRNKETGKHHIDLWEANCDQLLHCGVPSKQIELAKICTYINHEDFFSARRLGIDSGRTLSGIMLKDQSLKY